MPSTDDIKRARQQLEEWRRSLEAPFDAATAANDTAEMERLKGLATDIDAVLDELALLSLGQLAASLVGLQRRIEKHRDEAAEAAVDFGGASLKAIKETLEEIFARSSEEAVSEPMIVAPPPDLSDTATAPPPEAAADGRLVLTEAHLIALWKRSQFPIDGRGIILFGLRGCRPVDFSGTGFRPEHEITILPIDYKTMNCTLGQWRPGGGIALFPGSTVPFGATVQSRIAHGGEGVDQMGRGRYTSYIAGWHKRSEGEKGHWALLQNCPITLQRTADDADFDERDRWEVGRIAGDNIHCAFHMGEDDGIPDVRFSSAGCQTVAGTVQKGVKDSARGPWRRFMEPFSRDLGGQKSAEYMLFNAEEAQQVIRTRYVGKSIILRMGSAGPWVEDLQKALVARGARIEVDGDFGPSTFQAVLDLQSSALAPKTDDGVVGPETAAELGITLPVFDFDDAISGGPGYSPRRVATGRTGTVTVGVVPEVPTPGDDDPISWGAIVVKKHGRGFKTKVIQIARRLRCDPNHLMAVMAFETGDSFAPDRKDDVGSDATGLIRFMPDTAKDLGTTTDKLATMSAMDQLDFVEKYFRSVARAGPLFALSDVFMAVLLPSAIGTLESHVLFARPSKDYDQNLSLDINKNARTTKAEATSKVHDRLVLGMKDGRFG